MMWDVAQGDCRDILDLFPDEHFDSCVTDPPYGLRFMGKVWDYDVPSVEVWREVLRVLKPGAHLLAFGGARTYHRVAVNIEDAGFEIRDQIMWLYGSGFPKSKNIGGGRGTALKPAHEPIVLARKPLIGSVAENAEAFGTGALNIDTCRVETTENLNGGAYAKNATDRGQMWGEDAGNSWRRGGAGEFQQPTGRWPANVIHDGSDEVLAAFPDAPDQIADASVNSSSRKTQNVYGPMARGRAEPSATRRYADRGATNFAATPGARRLDSGSAARFFYCAKASRADRGADNNHPTVKPTQLMRYLCRLVTPRGGVVLDPFCGSGSTGRAAKLEGFGFVGVEREAEYVAIAKSRIAAVGA